VVSIKPLTKGLASSFPTPIFLNNRRIPSTMAQEKSRMPMSTAGITTYFEEYRSKIEFKPGHIIVFSIVVILIVVALHLWGTGLLGLT